MGGTFGTSKEPLAWQPLTHSRLWTVRISLLGQAALGIVLALTLYWLFIFMVLFPVVGLALYPRERCREILGLRE